MKDLQEILREKEQTVKRLEKEIESIRIVLGILDEEELHMAMSMAVEAPVPAEKPAPSVAKEGSRTEYAAPSQNRIPPAAAPFTATANASAASPDLRKPSPRNWP